MYSNDDKISTKQYTEEVEDSGSIIDGYVCSFDHSAVRGDLKMEDNGSYATKENFLYQNQCKKCRKCLSRKMVRMMKRNIQLLK